MSYSKTILIGNLGQDPEVKSTNSGKSVCNIRLATSSGYGEKARTEWHNIVCWEKTADNCGQYLRKGSKIAVEGENRTRSWEDKSGNKKYTTEVHAWRVLFLDPKADRPVDENVGF